ncbi:laccase [Phlebopus sp. FC_14]|nr:laccase [Phlebopus sp. FC_14]
MRAISTTSLAFLFSVAYTSLGVSIVKESSFDGRGLSGSWSAADVVGPVAELEIVNKVIKPDGYARSAVLAGGVFPGPLIKAQKGDNFSINVVNKLHDASMDMDTSIHWHGLVQNRSNWADGVSFVTQCPIRPNNSFQYRFNAREQAGTFWYHSHQSLQYCDGLRGALVIYDPKDPHAHLYDVDDENTVIMLSDWFHEVSNKVVGPPFNPSSTLVNGLGRYPGGPMSPLAVFNVVQGKRYRFRIIGGSCDPWFNFTIDGHTMTIIEADGIETVPVEVDSLPVLAGQRYSVVVTANKPISNYWIRAMPNSPNQTFENGRNSAVLRYVGARAHEPTTKPGPYVLPFDESALHPLENSGAPGIPEIGKADVNINLAVGLGPGGFTVNGVSYRPPPVPVLLQMLSGARHPSELLPSGSVYELPRNKVVEITIPATDLQLGGARGAPHGIHLHGHSFQVIRTSTNGTPNFVNPIRRDTASMGFEALRSNLTFRFVTDNPGPWLMHCHIDFHLHSGFAIVMAEAPADAASQQNAVVPALWNQLCAPSVTAHNHTNMTRPTNDSSIHSI